MSSSRPMCFVVAAMVVACLLAGPALAQQPATGGVAFLDINYVFENHAGFKSQLEAIKTDLQQEDAALQERAKSLQAKVEELRGYKAGSPEYVSLEREITRAQADMKVDAQNKRREIMKREASLHLQMYQSIRYYAGEIAKHYGYSGVIRVRHSTPDPEQPEAILQYISEQVVWQAEGRDITQQVLQALNNATGSAPAYSNTRAPTGTTAR